MNYYITKRHCYVETIDGISSYYAFYDGQSIPISKEVFEVLSKSYARECYQERAAKTHSKVSLDQLYDNILNEDYHGSLQVELQQPSVEADFIEQEEISENHIMACIALEEIRKLPTMEKELIMSIFSKTTVIEDQAMQYGISVRMMYYRRQKLAEQIAQKCRRRMNNDY